MSAFSIGSFGLEQILIFNSQTTGPACGLALGGAVGVTKYNT